jgi:glyoxylase-like metal-dependent hydrolase (beta-lactamase superfamily II)
MERAAEEHQVLRFETAHGAQIFQIPLLAFPGLWGYAYVVLVDYDSTHYQVLIDTGSGVEESNRHLEQGFQSISSLLGQPFDFQDLTHILVTHGHIDHFGGLTYVRPRTKALLGIHELDLRNLTNYEERLVMISRRLELFLVEAGVPVDRRQGLIDLYKITKSFFQSVSVDFTFESTGMRLGPFEMLHVPGHCAGLAMIRLDDILFSGDHILSEISPHQSPEYLTPSTGLAHYLRSLERANIWADKIRLTLAGHKQPINDLPGRIREIINLHKERLMSVLAFLDEPHTIAEVAKVLFGDVHGYNVLLALEEAGAHVEYLDQRGLLGIENLRELELSRGPIPVRYRCLPRGKAASYSDLGLI